MVVLIFDYVCLSDEDWNMLFFFGGGMCWFVASAGKTKNLAPMTSLTTSDLIWVMLDLSLSISCCCDSESIGKTCVMQYVF